MVKIDQTSAATGDNVHKRSRALNDSGFPQVANVGGKGAKPASKWRLRNRSMNIADIHHDVQGSASASNTPHLSWYALHTRSNYEKITASYLEARGFEQFLPLCRPKKRLSGKAGDSSVSLFPGYLFCRFDGRYRSPVLGALGVVSIVAFGGKPAPIEDSEIEAIRRAIGSGRVIEPHPYLYEGQKIRVASGPLTGLEGILVKKLNWRIVISVQMLLRAVAVEIDPESVVPIDRRETRPPGEFMTTGICPGAYPIHERQVSLAVETISSSPAGD